MNFWPHECDKQHAVLCQRKMNGTILAEIIYMWIFMINNMLRWKLKTATVCQ